MCCFPKAIPANAPAELQAVKLLATYKSASDENRELVLDNLKEMKEQWTPEPTTPAGVQLLVALIHFEARNYKEALRMVHKGHEQLEQCVAPPLSAPLLLPSPSFPLLCFFPLVLRCSVVHSLALTVQIYLKIDRLDLAAKQVKAMQDIDDDDALTALATAWLYIATVCAATCLLSPYSPA